MELSGSFSHPLGSEDNVYLYAGLPGEPACGPPAFMHRLSILDSPEAPISHHWLDSTHITNGVVTVGYVHSIFKLEASRFDGREPDQYRYRIEPGPLDSTAARFSWNPAQTLSLQVSWARQISPEQLAPREDETRSSASAIYTEPLGANRYWSTSSVKPTTSSPISAVSRAPSMSSPRPQSARSTTGVSRSTSKWASARSMRSISCRLP